MTTSPTDQPGPDRLPCAHLIADSLFTMEGGGRALIVHPPVRNQVAFIDLPAIIWCTQGCGWVNADDDVYERLKALRA